MSRSDEAGRWRPIAEAPRDGTRILVTVKSSEQGPATVDTAYWGSARRTVEASWRAAESNADCIIAYQEVELLGWMPLPAPGSEPDWPEPMSPADVQEQSGSGI